MVLRFGSAQTQPDCELYDCSIPRPSNRSASPNFTVDQLNQVGMHPVRFHPARTGSMGAFLDAAASVQNASCLSLTASLTLTLNMTETYSLNFMCDGSPLFFSRGFLLEGGCLRFYHNIDLRKCTFFRRERLRITNHVDGLTAANFDYTGGLIAQGEFAVGNDSTGKPETPSNRSASSNCTVRQFEKFGMYPTQDYPAQTESMGSFLDVAASVRDKRCLILAASIMVTVNKKETFGLNFICDGNTFFSKAFRLENGCIRPYPDIDPRECTFFRQERLRVTTRADGLMVANFDSTGSSNCTVQQFEKIGMYPTQDHPAQTESMGAFLDVAASVRDKRCLILTASLTLTVKKAETFSLNFICNGSTFFSKAFLLEGGCLRPYPDIDPRKCPVLRRERIRITDNADGLTVANLDSTGRLIAEEEE
ncbi:hypothetical protein pipiens_010999 [Culex pipiens pipiens]|uniref:Uncharacterized protein n=1 Tax=Culex pipiens pipiens TaxID=38569 RepID=A0ABD1D9K9_CULPP